MRGCFVSFLSLSGEKCWKTRSAYFKYFSSTRNRNMTSRCWNDPGTFLFFIPFARIVWGLELFGARIISHRWLPAAFSQSPSTASGDASVAHVWIVFWAKLHNALIWVADSLSSLTSFCLVSQPQEVGRFGISLGLPYLLKGDGPKI